MGWTIRAEGGNDPDEASTVHEDEDDDQNFDAPEIA